MVGSVNGSASEKSFNALVFTMPCFRLASSSSVSPPTWLIQPPFGRGFAACGGARVGSTNGAAVATLAAGSVPRTPGRAPGGGGGRVSPAGAGTGARACSLGRGRPANGVGAADADWTLLVFAFTLNVFTVTGWIGSFDPGVARGAAPGAGRSRCTGTLLELA